MILMRRWRKTLPTVKIQMKVWASYLFVFEASLCASSLQLESKIAFQETKTLHFDVQFELLHARSKKKSQECRHRNSRPTTNCVDAYYSMSSSYMSVFVLVRLVRIFVKAIVLVIVFSFVVGSTQITSFISLK